MNTSTGKKKSVKFPRGKIYSVVQTVLPKGADFHMQVINSNIGRMKIVRVVTPAWKKLPPSDRILKIINAANTKLSVTDRKEILRFSVLTPDELKLVTHKPVKRISFKTKNAALAAAS
jgi:hypothetical protein